MKIQKVISNLLDLSDGCIIDWLLIDGTGILATNGHMLTKFKFNFGFTFCLSFKDAVTISELEGDVIFIPNGSELIVMSNSEPLTLKPCAKESDFVRYQPLLDKALSKPLSPYSELINTGYLFNAVAPWSHYHNDECTIMCGGPKEPVFVEFGPVLNMILPVS